MWEDLILDSDYSASAWFGAGEGLGGGGSDPTGSIIFFLPHALSGGFWSGGGLF